MKVFIQYLKMQLANLCYARSVCNKMQKDKSFSDLQFRENGKIHFLERVLSDKDFLDCGDFADMVIRVKNTSTDNNDREACYTHLASLWTDFTTGV